MKEWQRYQRAIAGERETYAACDRDAAQCPQYLVPWRREIRKWSGLHGLAQLEAVNGWINRRIKYVDDSRLFGVADRWATPGLSLKGHGDCEDYALAKYQSLLDLGIPAERMRIVIVKDTRKGIGHAVLTVTTGDGRYVLDNQSRRVLSDADIGHYAPVYSVNAQGRWLNIATRRIKPALAAATEPVSIKPTIIDEGSEAAHPLHLELRPTLTGFVSPAGP